jgi:dATP pyrophosphohydrolase
MKKRKAQVAIFHLDEQQQKVFLLLKTNKKRGEFWQNVTGSVEAGESYQEGALREAIEETGLTENNIKKMSPTEVVYQFVDRWKRDVKEKTYLIEVKKPWDVKIDPKEHCKYKWVPEKELHPRAVKFISNYLTLVYAMETKC